MITDEYTAYLYHYRVLKKHYNDYNVLFLLGSISLTYLRICISYNTMIDSLDRKSIRSYMTYFMVFCWVIYRRRRSV